MPDSCMTAGSKPIYISRIHTQNLNIPSRVSLNGSFDDQVKQHLESKLKQHPKEVKPILKVNKVSDGHWAPDPVTSIASTIPFAFQGLHGCSSSFSSVFYIWRQRASISRPPENRFLRAITKVNDRPCNGHFLSQAVLAPRKWVFLHALHRTNHLKKQFFEGDPWGGPPLQIFVA